MNRIVDQFIKLSLWSFATFFIVQLVYSWINIDSWKSETITDIATIIVGFIGKAMTFTTLIMTVFNKFAWKWKLVKCIHNVPILKKSYEGKFLSTYDNIERCGTLFINQTFLNISVMLVTAESKSRSITAYLDINEGFSRLIYTYQNDPHGEIQDKSPIHYGTSILIVSNTETLEGNYFTGRKTTGSMKFNAISD